MHGYEMIQQLDERTGGIWKPSPGSVYPTLQMLEDEGLVTSTKSEGRKLFTLTDEGAPVAATAAENPPWATIGVFFIPMPAIVFAVLYIAYSIWMDKRGGDNINHGAHLAGAAYGVLFLVVMDTGVVGHFLQELSRPSLG